MACTLAHAHAPCVHLPSLSLPCPLSLPRSHLLRCLPSSHIRRCKNKPNVFLAIDQQFGKLTCNADATWSGKRGAVVENNLPRACVEVRQDEGEGEGGGEGEGEGDDGVDTEVSALSPQPSALSPPPSALGPQPSALSPQPSALSPRPSALTPRSDLPKLI